MENEKHELSYYDRYLLRKLERDTRFPRKYGSSDLGLTRFASKSAVVNYGTMNIFRDVNIKIINYGTINFYFNK